MRRNRLRLARPTQHEQLRQDRHALEPDGEGPEDLVRGEGVVEDEGEEGDGGKEVGEFEGVEGGVLGWPVEREKEFMEFMSASVMGYAARFRLPQPRGRYSSCPFSASWSTSSTDLSHSLFQA